MRIVTWNIVTRPILTKFSKKRRGARAVGCVAITFRELPQIYNSEIILLGRRVGELRWKYERLKPITQRGLAARKVELTENIQCSGYIYMGWIYLVER